MGQAYGTKESEEVLIAVKILGVFLVKRLKDGVGADDLLAVIQKIVFDGAFVNALKEGMDGSALVPKELADLDAEEIRKIAGVGLDSILAILAELGISLGAQKSA